MNVEAVRAGVVIWLISTLHSLHLLLLYSRWQTLPQALQTYLVEAVPKGSFAVAKSWFIISNCGLLYLAERERDNVLDRDLALCFGIYGKSTLAF
jgi:hypothetical protein